MTRPHREQFSTRLSQDTRETLERLALKLEIPVTRVIERAVAELAASLQPRRMTADEAREVLLQRGWAEEEIEAVAALNAGRAS